MVGFAIIHRLDRFIIH